MSMSVCLSVCLSACSHNSKTALPNLTEFLLHVARGHGSLLPWRHCNTLRTSGFVDDVMFSHNAPITRHVQWRLHVGTRGTGPPNLAQAPKFFQGNLGVTFPHVW